MLDKAALFVGRTKHAPAGQQFIMTENLVQLAIISGQRKPQPCMDTPADLNDPAYRLAPLQRG